MTYAMIGRRAVLVGTATLATTRGAAAADTLKLAIGQRGDWETAPPHLGQEKGFFRDAGIELTLLYTQGGGETMQAVISQSVDIGIGVGTAGVMAAFSKGAPVRAVGNATTGANDLYWYVSASSPVKSFKDLAGKTVAYSTTGSSTNLAVLGLMDFYNVGARPVATGSPASTFTQVMSGQIDCGWAAPPFGLEAIQKGQIRLIARGSEVPTFQNQTIRLLIANLATVEGKADATERFLAAYSKTLDWMYSGNEALKAYSNWTGISFDLAEKTRTEFFPRDTLRLSRLAGMDIAMKDAVAQKFIAAPLPQDRLDVLFKYYAKV